MELRFRLGKEPEDADRVRKQGNWRQFAILDARHIIAVFRPQTEVIGFRDGKVLLLCYYCENEMEVRIFIRHNYT